ncbi:MAG TPA: hypothetical protein VF584_15120 [Longimicrobium sp.]|jgi:hypothetical protein
MAQHYYGTSASLAWILAHYFYGRSHYTWLAVEYFPYRLPNPKSSNPHLIYQDLYQPWRDRDDFDKLITQTRLNLRKGIILHERMGTFDLSTATQLKDICDTIDIVFFYPLVYRVDIDMIPPARRHVAGSGLVGSHEYLVADLAESEFDILLADYRGDPDLRTLVVDEVAGISTTSQHDALVLLNGRC